MVTSFVNVGIAVEDLEEAIAFFTDLGLTLLGQDEVRGGWSDVVVGIDGNHAKIAMLETPGGGQLELFEYLDDLAIPTSPTLPNELGMHRVSFLVDDIDAALAKIAERGYHPLRGVGQYLDLYRLSYVRGPSGIIVMLNEDLQRSSASSGSAAH